MKLIFATACMLSTPIPFRLYDKDYCARGCKWLCSFFHISEEKIPFTNSEVNITYSEGKIDFSKEVLIGIFNSATEIEGRTSFGDVIQISADPTFKRITTSRKDIIEALKEKISCDGIQLQRYLTVKETALYSDEVNNSIYTREVIFITIQRRKIPDHEIKNGISLKICVRSQEQYRELSSYRIEVVYNDNKSNQYFPAASSQSIELAILSPRSFTRTHSPDENEARRYSAPQSQSTMPPQSTTQSILSRQSI